MNLRKLNDEMIDKQVANVDLDAETWELLLHKQFWGDHELRWIDGEFKAYLLAQIGKIQNASVQQNAMWQALSKESFLGNVFYIQLELTASGITSGPLKAVAEQLNKTKLPFDIEIETLIKLLRDRSLMRAIKENYPNLYKNLREHSLHLCPQEFREISESNMTWVMQRLAGIRFDFSTGIDVVVPEKPIQKEAPLLELVDRVESPAEFQSVNPEGSINTTKSNSAELRR